jgi:hypothetical protein
VAKIFVAQFLQIALIIGEGKPELSQEWNSDDRFGK